jgi:hypothetical protein
MTKHKRIYNINNVNIMYIKYLEQTEDMYENTAPSMTTTMDLRNTSNTGANYKANISNIHTCIVRTEYIYPN